MLPAVKVSGPSTPLALRSMVGDPPPPPPEDRLTTTESVALFVPSVHVMDIVVEDAEVG